MSKSNNQSSGSDSNKSSGKSSESKSKSIGGYAKGMPSSPNDFRAVAQLTETGDTVRPK